MKRAVITIALITAGAIVNAENNGYSLDEANAFHNEWNIDNWDEGGPLMRYVFLNMAEFWNHSLIRRGGPVRELPVALRDDVGNFAITTRDGKTTLSKYIADSTVNGALVMHAGEIVFEAYPNMRAMDKHNYMSVSKGFTSTLIAILEDRELIDTSVAIDSYLPRLKDSGWAGIPVIDILDMASGIGCLETDDDSYTNPDHCYYQFEASLGWLGATEDTPDNPFEYISTLTASRPTGEAFEYTSPNTFVLAWLAESVTGKGYADLLSTEIWQEMGAESDGIITAPSRGIAIAHGGISSNLRDMARFGLLFTPSGRKTTSPIVSDAYLEKIQKGGRPDIFRTATGEQSGYVDGEPARHNSYQWDFVMDDGDFFKSGYGGQGLYISPSLDLVVAFFGTFDENRKGHEMTHIARQLAKSGLFN